MEVCRLCLELLPDSNNYVPLEGSMKDMVLIVSPELNLEISQSPIACIECSGSLEELFLFKTKCFENEELIRPKVAEEEKSKFSLNEILNGSLAAESLPIEKAKERMCRVCLEPINSESFTIMKPSEPDAYLSSMLTMCLPEIDLELTLEPVMCETCLEILQKLHHFKSLCLDIEEKLSGFCEVHGTNSSSQISLHNVLKMGIEKIKPADYVNIKTEDYPYDTHIKEENIDYEEEFEMEENFNDIDMMEEEEEEDHSVMIKQEEIDIKPEVTRNQKNKQRNKKKHDCSICRKPFFRRYLLVRHMQEHSGDKAFRCDVCNKSFTYKSAFEDHQKTHQEKTMHCTTCGRSFFHQRSLSYHIKYYHTGFTDLVPCKLCKRFFKESSLKAHIQNVHVNREVPACETCGKKFFDLSTLRRHVASVHFDEKNFACEECGQRFSEKRRMEQHRLRHLITKPEPLKISPSCELCGKDFFDKSTLRRHKNSVHGAAKHLFACPSCPKKYSDKPSLNRHIKKTHQTTVQKRESSVKGVKKDKLKKSDLKE